MKYQRFVRHLMQCQKHQTISVNMRRISSGNFFFKIKIQNISASNGIWGEPFLSIAISIAQSFSNERYLHFHDSWNTSICGSDEIQMCAHWWISRKKKTVGNITKQCSKPKHYSIRIYIVCQMIERWWWKVFRFKHFRNVKTIKPKIKYPKIKYKRNHKF